MRQDYVKKFNWEFDKGVNNWCTFVKDIFRFGTLPLSVETGRFTGIKHDDRGRPIFDTNNV